MKNRADADREVDMAHVIRSRMLAHPMRNAVYLKGKSVKKTNRVYMPICLALACCITMATEALAKDPEFSRQDIDFAAEELQGYVGGFNDKTDEMNAEKSAEEAAKAQSTATPKPAEDVEAPSMFDVAGKVTIIGDSVCLGAADSLTKNIANTTVDAKVSRPLADGVKIMQELINSGTLGEYVVIALGTNGTNSYQSLINKMIGTLPYGHKLILVTPFDGRWNPSWASYKTCQYIRSIKDKYSYVTVADWAAKIAGHVNYLASDKIHIAYKNNAISIYVSNIQSALDAAKNKAAK